MRADKIKSCVSYSKLLLFFISILVCTILCKKKPSEENYLEPINISSNSGLSENPSIAVDSKGTLHLVWNDDSPGNEEIFYTFKTSETTWSTIVNISNNSRASRYPSITVDKNNFLHLAWQDATPYGSWRIFYSQKPPEGDWSVPETISIYGVSVVPKLTVDDSCGLHLLWKEGFSPSQGFFCYATKPVNGNWQAYHQFPLYPTFDYEIKADRFGELHIVLRYSSGIYYLEKKPTGNWSDTVRIFKPVPTATVRVNPSLEIDYDGSLHIVWGEGDTTLKGIAYRKRTANNEWLQPYGPYKDYWKRNNLSLAFPVTDIGNSGKLYVVWGTDVMVGYGVKDGDVWQEPKILVKKAPDHRQAIAIDLEERIHFAWQGHDSLTGRDNSEIYYIEFKP
jgi:hypothetical protein